MGRGFRGFGGFSQIEDNKMKRLRPFMPTYFAVYPSKMGALPQKAALICYIRVICVPFPLLQV